MKIYRIRSNKALLAELDGSKPNTLRHRVLTAAQVCGVDENKKPTGFKVTAIRAHVNAQFPAGTVAPNDQISDHLSRSVKAGILRSSAIVRTVVVTETESQS